MRGQQISTAGNLLGQTVEGLVDGTSLEGIVERVIFENGRVFLGLGERTLPLASVREVLG